jgi:hypothetical protein
MRSPGAVAARRASVSKARRWTSRAPGFQWDEALKIVQRAEDTFNRGDVDAILNRYAEDVYTDSRVFRKSEEGRRRRNFFAPDSRGKIITD